MNKFYILKCCQSIVLCIAVATLYAQPGSIDSSFGTNGFVTTTDSDREHLIGIQSTGKIIRAVGIHGFTLRRYNENGTIDSSFGTNGIVTTEIDSPLQRLRLLTILPDDGIIVFGEKYYEHLLLCRYDKNGKLDSAFGINGISDLNYTVEDIGFTAIAVAPGGRILLTGGAGSTYRQGFVTLCLDARGRPDAGFGNNGLVKTYFSDRAYAYNMQVQPDGKIIAVGVTSSSNNIGQNFDSVAIARYTTNGSLDKSFSGDGKLTFVQKDTQHLIFGAWALAVKVQPDKKILVSGLAGSAQSHGRWTIGDHAIWRLNEDGTFDSTFANNGFVTIDISPYELSNALALETDGRIIVSGNSGSIDLLYPKANITRLNTNGSVDSTFGNKGTVSMSSEGPPYDFENTYSRGIALGKHRIYVEGEYSYGVANTFLTAIRSDSTKAQHNGGDSTTIIPFAFTAFHGTISDSTVQLTWQTSHEKSLKPFTIERGKDSINFSVAGNVQATNTPGDHSYTFSDLLSSDTTVDYYYRIKSLDSSGITHYTGILKFTLVVVPPIVISPGIDSPALTNKVSVSPNPVTSQTKLVVLLEQSETLDIFVSNSSGLILYQNHQRYPAGISIINIPFNRLPHGLYYIKIKGTQVNMNKAFKK